MLDLFNKRKRKLRKLNSPWILDYYDSYENWRGAAGVGDNWQHFLQFFKLKFDDPDINGVADIYLEFCEQNGGFPDNRREAMVRMWTHAECETYSDNEMFTVFFEFSEYYFKFYY